MAGRKSSGMFHLLAADTSGDESRFSGLSTENSFAHGQVGDGCLVSRKRRNRGPKKKKWKKESEARTEGFVIGGASDVGVFMRSSAVETVCSSTTVENEVVENRDKVSHLSFPFVELRQRSMRSGSANVWDDGCPSEKSGTGQSSTGRWRRKCNGSFGILAKDRSLDWEKLMSENTALSGGLSFTERSPFGFFRGQIRAGNAIRNTVSVGNENKRQRIYNTVFHVPLRCERLIVAGFFVSLDSFLSLLTVTPTRISLALWKVLTIRPRRKLDTADLSEIGCFLVLACGIAILQFTDISLIYHIIRGQGTIKLYVVYNVLEIFDKLLQSFGEDMVLFSSAEGLATCQPDDMVFALAIFILDQTIAIATFIVHSFILLAQAITLSTCIIAHNNALMALLVSNNFAEIKSNVFKRFSRENIQSLVHHDIIERFHIAAFLLFVLGQNILEAEESWFRSFVTNALLVYLCEIFVDMVKHSFLSKFNEAKPVAYSEFLEDLCKQTLKIQTEQVTKSLNFIPLAPACVVIRVLTPIYATLLPSRPLFWRWLWIFSWSVLTFVILGICKIIVGLTFEVPCDMVHAAAPRGKTTHGLDLFEIGHRRTFRNYRFPPPRRRSWMNCPCRQILGTCIIR